MSGALVIWLAVGLWLSGCMWGMSDGDDVTTPVLVCICVVALVAWPIIVPVAIWSALRGDT